MNRIIETRYRIRKAVWLFLFVCLQGSITKVGGQSPILLSWKGATVPGHWRNPNLHEVNLRLRLWIKKIHEELAMGRITADQAAKAMNQIRDIRLLESRLYFGHGQQDITDSEKAQLIGMIERP